MRFVNSLSRATVAGAVVAIVVLAVAIADYSHAHDRYVALLRTPPCPAESLPPSTVYAPGVECEQDGLATYEQARQIQDGFKDRAVLYTVALGLIVVAVCAAALRARPNDRARIFNNLGIAGVCALIAAAVAAIATDSEGIGLGVAPWLLSPAMLTAAVVGRLRVRGEHESRAAWRAWHVWLALAVTAVVGIGALAYASAQPDCGGAEPVADAPDAVLVLGLIGIGTGLLCLATRHWISALIAIVANPIAMLFILGASCAFY
ncbi:MAG: hypothetical protein ACJ75R_05145 [Solirubrobacterales bacterium]